ncbi:DUF488 family protein, partial [Nonomuraea sp. NPDC050733]|uniref:DUF488 domain-containing protein n=1 Tax=Nonomuraea sp. NPDC050733 TaxID=3154633 RepID=UPI0033C70F6C
MAGVRMRRVYEEPAGDDGTRVLVDRVWPRGLSKAAARLDEWCKQVAPSTELRRWYGHDPDRFAEFTRRYLAELEEPERGGGGVGPRAPRPGGPRTPLDPPPGRPNNPNPPRRRRP